MWSVDNEALEEDFGHNFSEAVILHLEEEMQHQGAEPMGMCIRVT